ncbi:GrpB family protein [Bariatricus sp. SGI.154]|uniref:GrpB family protein n=1 Tax=Bariatricus sp. SGI.154 TaxID=3420549 RepID=UPI003CFC050F
MARKIEVVDYNSEWEKMYKVEEKRIKSALGKNCAAIYHIGSTSVKGLKAKPIIDIMPVVKDITLVDESREDLESLGYEYKGEYGIPGRRFCMKGGDNRTYHVHIFEVSNQNEINRHLAVRDYLRSHADTAKEYAELKTCLAAQFTYDNDGYCDGKDTYMKKLEQDALEWKKEQERRGSSISMGMSIGMCFGAGIGAAIGAAFSNIGMGMCFGVSIGMCIGMAIGAMRYRDDDRGNI